QDCCVIARYSRSGTDIADGLCICGNIWGAAPDLRRCTDVRCDALELQPKWVRSGAEGEMISITEMEKPDSGSRVFSMPRFCRNGVCGKHRHDPPARPEEGIYRGFLMFSRAAVRRVGAGRPERWGGVGAGCVLAGRGTIGFVCGSGGNC